MDRHSNVLTTDEEIDAALERARNSPEPPRIVEASYHPTRGLDLFVLNLSDGRRLVLPREELQVVADVTQEQAAKFTTGPNGSYLWWPELDQGHGLDNLLEGRRGNEKWMEKLRQRGFAALGRESEMAVG